MMTYVIEFECRKKMNNYSRVHILTFSLSLLSLVDESHSHIPITVERYHLLFRGDSCYANHVVL